ncbi:hypothetical protein ACFXOT_36735, partial [Streptomyces anulatus]
SKTVHSGAGTVVASMWGTIDYAGARCVMTPTVGTFVVPDLPVALPEAPAAPPAPEPRAVSPGSGESSSGTPTSQAPAAPAPAPAETTQPAPPAPPAAANVGG